MRKKFAFLIHPRNTVRSDMGLLLGPAFGLVPNRVWSTAFAHLPVPPVVTGSLSYADEPESVVGSLITVPLTPTQLLTLPRNKVQAKISEAVDKARDLGAEIVGLGALTAPASAGGKAFTKRTDIGVTNGNAYTAAMTMLGMERLMVRMRANPLIAIVGATGSVGSCLTRLWARQNGGRLLLVARSQGRLQALGTEARSYGADVAVSADMAEVRKADLIVLLTSAADAILRSEHLKAGAVVLDDTVPRNTDARLAKERDDVLVVDGGLVEIPGVTMKGGSIGLAPKLAYACLAETMLLALAGHQGHFSIGTPSVEQAEHMLRLAARYKQFGFHLASFRSFGHLISEPVADVRTSSGRELALCVA